MIIFEQFNETTAYFILENLSYGKQKKKLDRFFCERGADFQFRLITVHRGWEREEHYSPGDRPIIAEIIKRTGINFNQFSLVLLCGTPPPGKGLLFDDPEFLSGNSTNAESEVE